MSRAVCPLVLASPAACTCPLLLPGPFGFPGAPPLVHALPASRVLGCWIPRRKLAGQPIYQFSRVLCRGVELGQQLLSGSNGTGELLQSVRQAFDLPGTPDGLDEEELHEDISVEHGQAAASVGRAVYEVLKVDAQGKGRRIYVKRRDLLRANGLQPRDLRRIDPSLSPTKTSPNITVKDNVLLINIGGIRAILAADKCLLFEPSSPSSKKFLEIVQPRLVASAGARVMRDYRGAESAYPEEDVDSPPFELEMVEGALLVATGRLEAELVAAQRRMLRVLQILPLDITPGNLEELRRVKQLLVELESKADNLREMLEALMDDEDEVREINLSSRPKREEKRRARERDRIEREMEREQREWRDTISSMDSEGEEEAEMTLATYRKRMAAYRDAEAAAAKKAAENGGPGRQAARKDARSPKQMGQRWEAELRSYDEGEEAYAEAEVALTAMEERYEEERELEEVEDLLEYYLQRAANTQSEAERMLAGARDLEESIGVSLSARRFDVNRLELTLSIGSFAASLGAVVAGIFGMNLRSTLEESILGFWGCTALIVLGCIAVCWGLYRHTKRLKIL